MLTIPKKVKDRLSTHLKRFQSILSEAKNRDINEADTVTIIKDFLAEVLGYDKYSEITSEHQIRGTYCDLAVQFGGKIRLIIEVKAIGIDLKDIHIKQAIDYAANQGTEWVALTNGELWQVYRLHISKIINKELVLEFNLLELNSRSLDNLSFLYLLSREGRGKSALKEFHIQRQAASRYAITATLLDESILAAIRRELKLLTPDAKVQTEDIEKVLFHEVIKREVVESEKFKEIQKKLKRANKKKGNKKSSVSKDDTEFNAGDIAASEQSGDSTRHIS